MYVRRLCCANEIAEFVAFSGLKREELRACGLAAKWVLNWAYEGKV